MACLITSGRYEPCKSNVGGLFKIWFANFGTLDGLSLDTDDTIIGITTGDVYEYELKGANTFSQTITSSREAGTTYVTQSLTISLKTLDADTNKEIKLLAYGRPHIIIQDNNGNSWLAGREFGMELETSEAVTGTALADTYGYNLTFTGMERMYANLIKGSSISNPFGDSTFPTPIKGTTTPTTTTTSTTTQE